MGERISIIKGMEIKYNKRGMMIDAFFGGWGMGWNGQERGELTA
jgi:hypothetical protein